MTLDVIDAVTSVNDAWPSCHDWLAEGPPIAHRCLQLADGMTGKVDGHFMIGVVLTCHHPAVIITPLSITIALCSETENCLSVWHLHNAQHAALTNADYDSPGLVVFLSQLTVIKLCVNHSDKASWCILIMFARCSNLVCISVCTLWWFHLEWFNDKIH